jgi:phage terminase Nu1 subunit (DNA packaging protein)
MQNESETLHREIIREIAGTLGYTEKDVPTQINEADASKVLGVKATTLGNWRTTGRYNLPYVKAGRLVRYRVADLAAWIAKRRTGGEG